MKLDLSGLVSKGMTVAVAVSGGSDSMALLHYLSVNQSHLQINVVALNVEHGIRGKDSVGDSLFVSDYCARNDIPVISYSVDAPLHAKNNKLSIEQSARILRYECFFDAIINNKCDVVATAHHSLDNAESVLLNLFRGTGLKGVSGIKDSVDGKIIRPLLSVTKDQILNYVDENNIPFVVDKTNLLDDYTRNFIRLNVIPKIEQVFPEAVASINRFSQIAKCEDAYLDRLAQSFVKKEENVVKIDLSCPQELLPRAAIIALKLQGLDKDWVKSHVDAVCSLKKLSNGSKISLPKDFIAFKEYDTIIISIDSNAKTDEKSFFVGDVSFLDQKLSIERQNESVDLKTGFYGDLDKIPSDAVIRTKRDGDVFTKFGGGTKSLGDYLTDKKIPLRLRDSLPLVATKNDVLVIFGVAISDKIKVDSSTKNIIKFTRECTNET